MICSYKEPDYMKNIMPSETYMEEQRKRVNSSSATRKLNKLASHENLDHLKPTRQADRLISEDFSDNDLAFPQNQSLENAMAVPVNNLGTEAKRQLALGKHPSVDFQQSTYRPMLSLNLSNKEGIFEDNFVQNTLNAAVCEYLGKNECLTIRIRVLGKFGVGKTSMIGNYLSAKRD